MKITVIGIDCATQDKKLGLAVGTVDVERVVVHRAVLGSEVGSVAEAIHGWIEGPTLLAIDAPLGWPAPLARALIEHRAGQPIATARDTMFRRETDRFIHTLVGKTPLDVGADRIARTAHRALALLGDVGARLGHSIPVVWGGLGGVGDPNPIGAIEVYPAATLAAHGLQSTGYKRSEAAHRDARRRLVRALAGSMTLEVDAERLHSSDDRLDAVVCVRAGADYLRGDAVGPAPELRPRAEREGWIWVRAPSSDP